jgi:hypothetical protein
MEEEPGTFYISFDTQSNPGKLDAIRVRIDMVTIEDLEKKLDIGLCQHPLYSDLKKYVEANP